MILGVDPSTWTACATDEDKPRIRLINFEKLTGWKRVNALAVGMQSMLEELKPDVVFIEGYNLRNKFNLIMMVEIGSMLRNQLFLSKIEWWDVPPTVLKKWTTGKGTAKKPDMAIAVKERWGFTHKSDDAIDAFALARLGRDIHDGNTTAAKLKITHGHYRG